MGEGGDAMSAAVRIPRCDVGAYQGPEDNEALWHGKRGGDPDKQAGTGTLVHLARDHANKQGAEVPGHLCRPTVAEDMHGKFKPVEQPAEGATDGTVAPGNTGHVGRFEMLDAAEDDEKPDPVWLFPTLMLPNTHVTLTGPPGTFESFFVLDIGLSAATGSREGRVWPVVNDPGAVLYATGEGGAGFKPRRRAWEKQHNGAERVTNFIRATAVPWSGNAADISAFISEARKKRPEGYRLLILDTANRAMAGQNQNAIEVATAFTALCERLRDGLKPKDGLGCTTLSIHHTGHADQDRAAGSMAFLGDADTALVVKREGKAMAVSITMTKQRDAPEWESPKVVKLIEVEGSLVVVPADGAAPLAKNDPHRDGLATVFALQGVVETALRSTINGVLANSALARMAEERLRDDHKIEVSASRIRNHYLPLLVKMGPAKRWYTTKTNSWCWRAAPGDAR
jgi:hypothetical protein